jgi:hypothetical protein
VDTARVEVAAEAQLAELDELDKPWRSEAAARARKQLCAEVQLWGVGSKSLVRARTDGECPKSRPTSVGDRRVTMRPSPPFEGVPRGYA